MSALFPIMFILIVGIVILASTVRVLQEWERGVVLRLGRLLGTTRGPGLTILLPFIDRMVKVDTRLVTLQVPPQEVISKDNVSTRVTAVVQFQVIDAMRAITQVDRADYVFAASQNAQTVLRSVLGQHLLDELLSQRDKINSQLQVEIDALTERFGVKVSTVAVKDVELPSDMQRAMAKEAEAERERRAKIINADGEFQASMKLAEAAEVMSSNPSTLQLRYLQTLLEIGISKNNTTLIPLPLDIATSVQQLLGQQPSAPAPRPPMPTA